MALTSGLVGVYAKGLRVATVVALSDPGGGLMQIGTLEAAVDFGRLEQVFVMLRRGRTMDLLYGSDLPSDGPGVDVDDSGMPGPEAGAGSSAEAGAPDTPGS